MLKLFPVAALLLAATSIVVPAAHAELLTDPSSTLGADHTRVGGVFASSEVDYEAHNHSFDVERKILGAEIGHGVGAEFDIVGQLGLILDTEVEDVDEDGDGLLFGGGARFGIWKSPKVQVTGFAVLSFQNEEIQDGSFKLELDTHEMHVGGIALFPVSPKVAPYAGADLTVIDDGEAETTVNTISSRTDVDRDDALTVRGGANFYLTGINVRPEVTIFAEQTFLISITTQL